MTPQANTVLKHLQQHGSISQAEAATVYRIRALPRRISDLKEAGHKITRELKKDPTGQRYARYSLDKEAKPEVKPMETKRVPEVGDRVRIVEPHMTFGEYREGSTGTLREIYIAASVTGGKGNMWYIDFNHHPSFAPAVYEKEFEVIS